MSATFPNFIKYFLIFIACVIILSLFLNPTNEIIPALSEIFPFLEEKSIFEFLYENTFNILAFIGTCAISYVMYVWWYY